MTLRIVAAILTLAVLAACAAVPPAPAPSPAPAPPPEKPSFSQEGLASWYGKGHQGHETANGEKFDMRAMTAAHRSVAFGTMLRVTNLDNAKVVKVRVNDRGPFVGDRVIDLSARAARELGIGEDGVARVRIEVFASDQGSQAAE
jgi:rare lipoprotein A